MLAKYMYAAAIVVGLTLVGGAYLKGRVDANAAAKAEAREELIGQLKERNEIDGKVSRMSPADICAGLDGVYVNGKCE